MGRHARSHIHTHTQSHMHACMCQSSPRTPQPHSVQQSRHSCCCSTAFLNEFYMFSALPLCFLCTPSGDGRRKVGSMQIPVKVKVFAFTLHTHTHTPTHTHMHTLRRHVYRVHQYTFSWLLVSALPIYFFFSLTTCCLCRRWQGSEVGLAWSWSCSVCLLLHLAAGEAKRYYHGINIYLLWQAPFHIYIAYFAARQ